MSSSTEESVVPPSSQNEWHRYIPRSPSSPLRPRRSRIRSAASIDCGLTPSVSAPWRSSAMLLSSVRRFPLGKRSA